MSWALLGVVIVQAVELPMGSAPEAVSFPQFPSRVHAYVWLNWQLVPVERLAEVVGATPDEITALGRRMGLPAPPAISAEQQRRSYITVIRRNWHLLPYEQLLQLLGWSAEELAYTLREDDFLFIKLGSLKPKCAPLRYALPTEEIRSREQAIAAVVAEAFPDGLKAGPDPLFGFVGRLSTMPAGYAAAAGGASGSLFSPRFCSSYFMLYGDPFLEPDAGAYPDGYLARLAETGVNGVWLQAVLYKLTPFPWDASLSDRYEERLVNLKALVARAKAYGIGVYLYLNEPRAMPLAFFEAHPEFKGVVEGTHAALCTSVPEVQAYIRDGVARICQAAPDLAGFFTITASENLTNCWSHGQGRTCPRCSKRSPAEVIAGLNTLIREGIGQAGSTARLIAWDWGWGDEWTEEAIGKLPEDVALMSVSEWSIPIRRGGVDSVVGEYSISEIGPGPRAGRHWSFARARGLKTLAKVQAGNTWELSAVPYIPALENVAQHASNLRKAGVDGIMLGWTLGGYPSPNLEVFAEMGRPEERTVDEVLDVVATRRFGAALAPAVVKAWRFFSAAFREFPYHGGTLYSAPQQMGPANPLWEKATGYQATMVGLPYDGLDQWRSIYPPEVFIAQFTKMADGFDQAIAELRSETKDAQASASHASALAQELDVAEVCAIHFRSVANQARFVWTRNTLDAAAAREKKAEAVATLERALRGEAELAKRLYAIQSRDSRIGFEASNHYFYVPLDLAAKVINCQDLLSRWLPALRAELGL